MSKWNPYKLAVSKILSYSNIIVPNFGSTLNFLVTLKPYGLHVLTKIWDLIYWQKLELIFCQKWSPSNEASVKALLRLVDSSLKSWISAKDNWLRGGDWGVRRAWKQVCGILLYWDWWSDVWEGLETAWICVYSRNENEGYIWSNA